jgi:hypothetical protein
MKTTEQALKQQQEDAERDRAVNAVAPIPENGFDSTAPNDRLIQGDILRAVDGKWSVRNESALPAHLLALGTTRALQRWEKNLPAETIIKQAGKPLPDVDELNSKIPQATWEKGLNGPRPPWQLQYVAHLLDPTTAAMYTYLNSTRGAQIAVERLESKVRTMRALRGSNVLPVVTLGSAPMPTQFGQKLRPEFVITGWRDLGGTTEPRALWLEDKTAKADLPGKPAEPVTAAEELNDKVSF